MSELLNRNELAAALGISRWTLARREAEYPGYSKRFEVTQPVGQRRYSPVLVERFKAGDSIVKFGRGSRQLRRSA